MTVADNTSPPDTDAAAVLQESPLRRIMSDYLESPLAIIGLIGTAIIVFIGIFAPLISPQNPYDLGAIDILDSLLAPGAKAYTGGTYWLGTDDQGRDMVSAIFYGLRLSIFVGIGSAVLAVIVGTSVGLCSAYFGGRVDTLVMRAVDVQISFPTVLIALILLSILGKGVDKVIMALVIVQWAYYARTVRGTALAELGKEYMEAGRSLALSNLRMIFRHLLPNVLPPLIVIATVQVANAIALEAALSFLGLGLPVTEPSLGLLISNGYDYLLGGKYWISVLPGVALLFTIISINLVGDRLRDVLNPRLQK
jgi:peptide/nickel transport system permease protein